MGEYRQPPALHAGAFAGSRATGQLEDNQTRPGKTLSSAVLQGTVIRVFSSLPLRYAKDWQKFLCILLITSCFHAAANLSCTAKIGCG